MRKEFCDALIERSKNPKMVFLTADLGFMALENLEASLKNRFINVGIAEQNMISVAAALAKQHFNVWTYSIAPFIYARPFEQIRNDVCFHNLPVKLVGNGGGYGYGVMGPTHHAIEDYGVLLTLPHMKCFIPAFDADIEPMISKLLDINNPSYLRMGRGELPKDYVLPDYKSWRQLTFGKGPLVISVGPLAGSYIEPFNELPEKRRPNLWVVSELPLDFDTMPKELITNLKNTSHLIVSEEHVMQGSLAMQLLHLMHREGISAPKFSHFYAKAHHYERYGSQNYLRKQSELDPSSMLNFLSEVINANS
jgi:transketolase